jgi:hypothetical protein
MLLVAFTLLIVMLELDTGKSTNPAAAPTITHTPPPQRKGAIAEGTDTVTFLNTDTELPLKIAFEKLTTVPLLPPYTRIAPPPSAAPPIASTLALALALSNVPWTLQFAKDTSSNRADGPTRVCDHPTATPPPPPPVTTLSAVPVPLSLRSLATPFSTDTPRKVRLLFVNSSRPTP